mmetsp:Transcript_117644/g.340098  ORF Transcript_117644/g.340098 Transcript_117644/m.340098 type:complete len:83 (+) Transcript_117644:569-817(+)
MRFEIGRILCVRKILYCSLLTGLWDPWDKLWVHPIEFEEKAVEFKRPNRRSLQIILSNRMGAHMPFNVSAVPCARCRVWLPL